MSDRHRKRKEADVLSSVRALLKARGILHFRRNVTKIRDERGKWTEFGTPGEADILAIVKKAFPRNCVGGKVADLVAPTPVFIECKGDQGKQSGAQILFQTTVEQYGCTYLLVRSAMEVEDWLRQNT